MRLFRVCVVALLVSSCVSVGGRSSLCGPNDTATRLTDQQIDLLSDEQVKDILSKNEALEKRGCAVANKG